MGFFGLLGFDGFGYFDFFVIFLYTSFGTKHSVALRHDGTIRCWGSNTSNQLINAPTEVGFTDIACGGFHSVGLQYYINILRLLNNSCNRKGIAGV